MPARVNDISEQRDAARTSLHGSAHRLGRELGTSSRMDDCRFAMANAVRSGGRIFGRAARDFSSRRVTSTRSA